jgi:hypothetical protein
VNTIDFNRSYLRFRIDPRAKPAITVTRPMPTTVLNVRINLECRCELFNQRTGRRETYVLGASCKTELVGADRDIWMEPNADFCVVTSNDEFMVLKSWACKNMPVEKHPEVVGVPQERQSCAADEGWADHVVHLHAVRGRTLNSIDEIIAAIRGDLPIVARTKYNEGDWQVTIEHPVKTINYSERENVYQTDTGPVLLPDLSLDRLARSNRLVECFDLAYAAFNSSGWAEFIVNLPTPVGAGISVNHYSKPRRIEPVENALFEVLSDSSQRHVGSDRAIRVDGAELRGAINGSPETPAMEVAPQKN